jgi:hypothetical protein
MIEEIIRYHEEATKHASKNKLRGLSQDERAAVYFHEGAVRELQRVKKILLSLKSDENH